MDISFYSLSLSILLNISFVIIQSAPHQQCIQYNILEMVRQLGEPSLNDRGQKIFIPPISIQSCIYISTTELRNGRPFYQNLIRENNGMVRRASLLEQNQIARFRQKVNAFIMSGGNMLAAMDADQGDLNGYGGGGQYRPRYNDDPAGQYGSYGGGRDYSGQYGAGINGFGGGQYFPANNQIGKDYLDNTGFNYNNRAFLRTPCFCQDCSTGLVLYEQGQTNTAGNGGGNGLNGLGLNIVVEGNMVTDADNCITYSAANRPVLTIFVFLCFCGFVML